MPTYGKVAVNFLRHDVSGTATDLAVADIAKKDGETFTGTMNAYDLIVGNNLTVNGTQTILNTETLQVEDKEIDLGKVSSPSNASASGGGIKLLGGSDGDKTITWLSSNNAWNFSEHIHLDDNKQILLGTDNDLILEHNNSSGFVWNTSGDTVIRGAADGWLNIQPKSGQAGIVLKPDGATEISHSGNTKLVSTSSGIDVTGQINVNGSPLAGGNTIELQADGAIAAGKPVIITTAGKAAQVAMAQTGRTNAPTNKLIEDLTTQDEFYSMVWDSNREVVVMGYANSNGGRGVNVFTYSTAIGTSTVTNHGQTTAQTANCSDNTSLAFDPDTNQFLFCYRLQTAGFLSVGTVASDKSVTFGSASEWDGQSPDEMYVEYNTDQNKVIVVFRKSNQLWARAGTVSGTGISGWGTAVQLSGIGISNDGKLDTCWDSTNNKVLVVFCDTDDNNKAKAVALSCSGTTLTWGSPSQLYNGQTLFPRIAFDSDLGKATATYEETSTNRGVMQVVYISSGTTIASGSAEYMVSTMTGYSGDGRVHLKGHQSVYDPVGKYFYIVACWTNSPTATDRVFSYQWKINNSNNTITRNTQYIRLLDSSTCQDHKWNDGMVVLGNYGKMVSVVRNIPNSYKPRLYLSELITSSTNITDRNVIGFANSAINDTATGTINIQGSIATGLSGLTPATVYFVQDDGTLGTSVQSTQASLLAIGSDKGMVQTRVAWT